MPLWVKSQDGNFLREFSGFRRIENRINGCAVDIEDGVPLAEYPTEERAKEVFEEIGMAVQGRFTISLEDEPVAKLDKTTGMFSYCSPKIEPLPHDRFIYEMPKE